MVAFMQISDGFPKVSMPEIDILCILGLGLCVPHGSSVSELVKQCHLYILPIDRPTSPRGPNRGPITTWPPSIQLHQPIKRTRHIWSIRPTSSRVYESQL